MNREKLKNVFLHSKPHARMNRVELRDVFLHGKTHAVMTKISIDPHGKKGVADMMFRFGVNYMCYTVVVTCYKNGNSWQEFWQLYRERWTKRETKMILAGLHDKIIADKCRMVTAKVYYGELTDFEYYGDLIMRFRTSNFDGCVRDTSINVSGSMYNPRKRVNRWWARPYKVGIH